MIAPTPRRYQPISILDQSPPVSRRNSPEVVIIDMTPIETEVYERRRRRCTTTEVFTLMAAMTAINVFVFYLRSFTK